MKKSLLKAVLLFALFGYSTGAAQTKPSSWTTFKANIRIKTPKQTETDFEN